MTPPEVRLSPDGQRQRIAVLFEGNDEWVVLDQLGFAWEADVRPGADNIPEWTPLLPVSTPERVTCPECGRDGRALDPQGRIRWHHGIGVWWSRMCPGTGIRLREGGAR